MGWVLIIKKFRGVWEVVYILKQKKNKNICPARAGLAPT